MNYKAIIFDLDGVLVDSYECWWHLVQDARKQAGKGPLSAEDFDAAWGQSAEDDQKMFFPDWSVSQLMQYYDANFLRYANWIKTEPGAKEVLQALKSKNTKIGVASNSTPKAVDVLLNAASLTQFVDVALGVDEQMKGKPEPDLILRVIEKLAVEPRDLCYVGDSIFDEQAARSANVFFVGYKREGDRRVEQLEELLSLTSS